MTPFGTGRANSSVELGDYDNDGDLDIFSMGNNTAGQAATSLFQTVLIDGSLSVTDVTPAGLANLTSGDADWGDFDRDGDLDLVITGRAPVQGGGSVPTSKVYRNNRNGSFTDINEDLIGVYGSSVAWGDYDNEGKLDILLTGYTGPNNGAQRISRVYRQVFGDFINIGAGLTGVAFGKEAADWGDIDNDGDLDIVLTGSDSSSSPITKLYRNNGVTTFTEIATDLVAVRNSSVAWGDMDNDGKLDLILSGRDSSNTRITRAYRNISATVNTAPNAPTNLAAVANGDAVTFSWTAATDIQTAASGLSYNLRVGTIPGSDDVFSTMADGITGLGRRVQAGPIQGTSHTLKGLDPTKTYFWSVQAIDTAFAGGAFAAEQIAGNTNTSPTIDGAAANQAVNDDATKAPFATLTVTDPDTQAMTATVQITNGTNRGDFTTASADGWTRSLSGADIVYTRDFAAAANIGTVVRDAIQFLVFQPRTNANAPGTTETTSFTVTVNDNIAEPVSNSATTVITTSVNDAPTIGNALANQAVNDNATIAPFAALTIVDPDIQAMTATVRINNGVVRGDFTNVVGWNRSVTGNNIQYSRTFSSAANIGAVVQAAVRALVFRPRENVLEPNKAFKNTETTTFNVTVTDGITPVTNTTTSVVTTSVNNAPSIAGASTSITANDNATVNPFPNLTVTDVDTQEMLISVTILNGLARGDFTPASTVGWATRFTTGNNITYKRYFSPQANVGAAVQAAFRALTCQPRQNAINPGTTEATDFQVTVSDGVAAAIANQGTRVTTTSVNNAPLIGGAVANQTMNDNQTRGLFTTITVTDPDFQNLFARVTITNGTNRGDFTAASSAGWTRKTSGANILYERFFAAAAGNATAVRNAIRALVFQPRTNVPVGTTETTSFTVFVNDGLANTTNSTTSVITTGVAPRPAAPAIKVPPMLLDSDITTVVLANTTMPRTNLLAKLLRKTL